MPDTAQTTPAAQSGGAVVKKNTPEVALESSRGTTNIADSVVTKVAGIAAREVDGVYALGGSGARALGSVTQRVGMDTRSQGVSVEVEEHEAVVEVTVVIEYGESIPETTEEIRKQIIRRVEAICGLKVTKVDIAVADLHFVGDDDEDDERA